MASGFQHDAQGFLIGEVINNGRDLMRAQQQGIQIWKTIRTDVKAIARAVGAQVSTNVRLSRPGAAPRAPSMGQRTLGGNHVSGARQAVAQPVGRSAPAQRGASGARANVPVVAQPRATNGRFVAGQRAASGGGSGSGDGAGSGSRSAAFSRMNDTLGKLASSLQATDNIDPTVNAMKEVKDVVSPLGRGLFSIFGRTAERRKERWYARILKALTPGGEKKAQPGGGGFFGMGGDAGGGGIAGSIGGGLIGRMAGGALGGLFGGAGKLMRRIPLLGALVAGGGALASMFGGGTRDEKYRGVGEAGGMLAGGFAGAKAGALIGAIGGPVGIAVGTFLGGVGGALLGEKFGAKVGEWTQSLMDSDIPGKVVEGWNATTAFIGAAWESVAGEAKTAWAGITAKAGEWLDTAKAGLDSVGKTLSETGNAVNDWIKGKTGIDVKRSVGEVASAGWSAAKGYGADALDAAKSGAAALMPNTVKRAYSAGMEAAGKVGGAVVAAGGAFKGSFKGAEARALETGKAYSAGNIAGLDDAHTRALVASTALTESGGGKLDVVNKLGFAGRYQAGAGWLADAGLINGGAGAVEAAMKKDGYKREADWGAAGGMTKFLKDDKNWNGGMTYDKYLASASTQDAAFKTNSDATYRALIKSGAITANTPQAHVAGLLKARHLAGLGGALAVARGGMGAIDANGTSASKYYRDMAYDPNGLTAQFRGPVVAGTATSMVTSAMPSSVPAVIPKATEVREPPTALNGGGGAGRGSVNVSIPETIGQNVSDRGTAHVVSGGLGMS